MDEVKINYGKKSNEMKEKYNKVAFEDLELSDDYLFAAYEEKDPKKRRKYLEESLRLNEFNGDSKLHLLLLEYDSDKFEVKMKKLLKDELLYLKTVHNLTEKKDEGLFYGFFETRPYMRMLLELMIYYDLKKNDSLKSLKIREKIMKLNPNDSLGVRFAYVEKLLIHDMYSKIKTYLTKTLKKNAKTFGLDYELYETQIYAMLVVSAYYEENNNFKKYYKELPIESKEILLKKINEKSKSKKSKKVNIEEMFEDKNFSDFLEETTRLSNKNLELVCYKIKELNLD